MISFGLAWPDMGGVILKLMGAVLETLNIIFWKAGTVSRKFITVRMELNSVQ